MGVKVDGRQLHPLRFADDIVLITPSISQAESMLTEFDETCGCIGLQRNLQKTMFMRNDGSRCIHAQRNEHMNAQLRLSGSERTETTTERAGGDERLERKEHRGCSEEDQEHPARAPLQHTYFAYMRNRAFRKQEEKR
ncbi:hypothetical protein RB195_003039 [Necator americanus]|uniref:Reverse transcriptase domain-containing protein n=1 Tax=Necator americanus TaxID=51031 RepID=A0ABR1DM59_NECAM